jgi:ATP-dependent helicase HrpA
MSSSRPASLLDELERRIGGAMLADQHRLRRKLRAIRRGGAVGGERMAQWVHELEISEALRRNRGERRPRVEYDLSLPVCQRRDEIAAAVRDNQVVIVCGETGSGKSTQLPKICLELGRGLGGMIGHTQPRRIAARSVAARIAQELKVPLGRQVGFKVRFTDATDPDTYVKLMTDGMLLAELQGDRFLEQYDTIILDEAHERSLNIDFLIGYLKQLRWKRRDLKLIITSATMDVARFAEHFAAQDETPAPIIEVAGRTYPVEVRYRPIEPDDETGDVDWLQGVLDAIDELARDDRGDMLVFMPTERDIHELAKALRSHNVPGDPDGKTQVLPLYARLSTREQQRVFQPHPHRRIVIATNVAESSLTVPGVRYVIDLGTARISRYSARSKTQRLPVERISRASADQRKGRCGRVGPGICVRLFDEEDYERRERFTPPEIQRTNLASVILQMKAQRLGAVEKFPFLDPPRRDAIRDGYKTLFELGTIDGGQQLTDLGRRLSRLPVDPRIGRMILAADDEDCLSEMLVIAAVLEIQDPRLRPIEHEKAADDAHAQFQHEESDFLTYLKLWDFYHRLRQKLSRNQLRKACRQNFLSYNRMREWVDIHRQLMQLVHDAKLRTRRRRDDEAAVHRAVLTGMLAHVAWRKEAYEYTTAGGGKAHLWPGSATFSKKPRWVVAAEVVETTRRYLRTCARIDPEWIESLAEHLVHRSYGEPHWDRASTSAMAYERVSLMGLPVVPRRRIALGPIDPETARQLLIQHGLVEAQWDREPRFLKHNRKVLDEIERLQQKLRRSDLMPSQWVVFDFYDRQVPNSAYDGPRLMRWLRKAERKDRRVLRMTQDAMLQQPLDEIDQSGFPDVAEVGSQKLPLEYRFEPGGDADGVTVRVPLPALSQVDAQRLGWLVPGMFEQKVVALIKALPKPIRRQLIPAPETAKRVVEQIEYGSGDLIAEVARLLGRMAGEQITPATFDPDKLPPELTMNVRVVDGKGKTVAMGRDLTLLRRELTAEVAAKVSEVKDTRFQKEAVTNWDFGELPERVEVNSGGVRIDAYPALVDQGDCVSLDLAESPDRAVHLTRGGLRRLFAIAAQRDVKQQLAWLPKMEQMVLWSASIRQFDLNQRLADLIADRAFVADQPIPRNAGQFERRLRAGRDRIGIAVQDVAELVPNALQAYHAAQVCVERWKDTRWHYAADDAGTQLEHLVTPDFLTETPWPWLKHFPRYFRAIEYRFDKLRSGAQDRDRAGYEEVRHWWDTYQRHVESCSDTECLNPELIHFRWMLEEYRVSLFAQPLGTAVPVSAKRLERQWVKVEGAS